MIVSKAVEDFLLASKSAEEEEHVKDPKDKKFYVSDSGKCGRIRWLKRKGIATEFDNHVYWILKIGQMYHDFAYQALEAQGRLLESEDYLSNDHFVCRFDGITKNDKDGKELLSIKSVGGYKFDKARKGDISEENIAQLMTELMLLKDSGRDDIDGANLLLINKEPGDKIPFITFEKHFELTKWREDKLRAEMNKLVEYWEKNQIPPCTCPAWMKPYNAFLPLCQASESTIRSVLEYLEAGKKVISGKKEVVMVSEGIRKSIVNI